MIVNSENLAAIYFGVSKAFQQAMESAKPVWKDLATTVPSGTREERYAWLGQFPRLREWIGERIVSNLSAYEYTIKNRKFESTIEIPREDIEDDSYGVFAPLFKELGFAAATHPDELLFELIGKATVYRCARTALRFRARKRNVQACIWRRCRATAKPLNGNCEEANTHER